MDGSLATSTSVSRTACTSIPSRNSAGTALALQDLHECYDRGLQARMADRSIAKGSTIPVSADEFKACEKEKFLDRPAGVHSKANSKFTALWPGSCTSNTMTESDAALSPRATVAASPIYSSGRKRRMASRLPSASLKVMFTTGYGCANEASLRTCALISRAPGIFG